MTTRTRGRAGGGAPQMPRWLERYPERMVMTHNPDLLFYQPMNEKPGATVALDYSPKGNLGAYTDVTLGTEGIGDGNSCASFNGSTSFNDLSASALGAQANYDVGSVCGFGKVSGAGVWTDGAFREMFRAYRDGNNNVIIGRSNIANELFFTRVATLTNKTITTTLLGGVLDWFHWALTWNTVIDQLIAYLNGEQVGNPLTGIGTFVGGGTIVEFIGAASATPSRPWSGQIAHVSIWKTVLSRWEIADLARR